jgi:hypothetical protein
VPELRHEDDTNPPQAQTVTRKTGAGARLRPGVCVLVRAPRQIQVGLVDPVVFDDLEPAQVAFLSSLEGRGVSVSRAERAAHGSLMEALVAGGKATSPATRDLSGASARVRGVDAVSFSVGVGLAASGIGSLSIDDPRPAPEGFPFGPSRLGASRAGALARAARDAHPDLRVVGLDRRVDLEIVRVHGAIDLALARRFAALDVSHVPIVSDEASIAIGPTVVPGTTACGLCDGFRRAERDPSWPRLALQLGGAGRWAGLVVEPDVALVAAGLALRESLLLLAGDASGGRGWRVPLDGGSVSILDSSPHPDCGCGATPSLGEEERRVA